MFLQMALFFSAEYYCIVYIYHTHLFVNAYLGCFCVLAIVNSVALSIGVPVIYSLIQIYAKEWDYWIIR